MLTDIDRQRVKRGLSRYWSNNRELFKLNKADLLAAVVATDTWIENNQAGYNNALPAAAKANLTAVQKTLLFCAVALARVSIEFLRGIFQEVD